MGDQRDAAGVLASEQVGDKEDGDRLLEQVGDQRDATASEQAGDKEDDKGLLEQAGGYSGIRAARR